MDCHLTHPLDCPVCTAYHRIDRACLSHTCPDCGLITWGEHNDDGELVHDCIPN